MVLENQPGEEAPGTPPSGQPPFKLIGAALVAIAIALLIGVVAVGGGGGDKGSSDDEGVELAGLQADEALPTPEATVELDRPAADAPSHLESVGAGDRLEIPKIGVSGPLAIKKVGLNGVMPDPADADEIAYYDFSAWPGMGGAPGRGGNAVFSGHVDSGSKPCKNGTVRAPCQAVFWDVKNLRVGDEVKIHVGDQTYTYRVTASESFVANQAPWDRIVSATAQETVTLITCIGQFSAGNYDKRLVVTAVRV